MKAKEIRELSDDALFQRGTEIREQLFRLRFKQQLGNTEVVHQIQVSRKDLARIKTEVRTRELAAAETEGNRLPRHRSREERKIRTRRSQAGRA